MLIVSATRSPNLVGAVLLLALVFSGSYPLPGARGSSVLFSSGDGGVGSGSCKSNTVTTKTEFLPTFPGACPFITSVGGTTGVTEKAASFSQGGFSNVSELRLHSFQGRISHSVRLLSF